MSLGKALTYTYPYIFQAFSDLLVSNNTPQVYTIAKFQTYTHTPKVRSSRSQWSFSSKLRVISRCMSVCPVPKIYIPNVKEPPTQIHHLARSLIHTYHRAWDRYASTIFAFGTKISVWGSSKYLAHALCKNPPKNFIFVSCSSHILHLFGRLNGVHDVISKLRTHHQHRNHRNVEWRWESERVGV